MDHIIGGYRGLGVLVDVNRDRILSVVMLGAALFAGAFIGSL